MQDQQADVQDAVLMPMSYHHPGSELGMDPNEPYHAYEAGDYGMQPHEVCT